MSTNAMRKEPNEDCKIPAPPPAPPKWIKERFPKPGDESGEYYGKKSIEEAHEIIEKGVKAVMENSEKQHCSGKCS